MNQPDWQRPLKLSLGGNKVDGWDCDVELMVWTPFREVQIRKRGTYHGSTLAQAVQEALTELSAEGL